MPTKEEKQALIDEILRLKKEKDALILAHYYQDLAIQQIADIVGDSFELAKKAKQAENRIIVFCGVEFMAESAKLLNPNKKVLLPRHDAGCLMANMALPEYVLEFKSKYPDAAVVCYVNTFASTKCIADICVTSSNAVKICRSIENKRIIFVPDENLGAYVASQVPEKEFILYDGYCPIHKRVTPEQADVVKAAHPGAKLCVHPECGAAVCAKADFVGSTSQILDYCINSADKEFIIGTEVGVVDRLEYYHPEKKYYLLSPSLVCVDMKKTTLADVLASLRDESGEVVMSDKMIKAAGAPLEKMVAVK